MVEGNSSWMGASEPKTSELLTLDGRNDLAWHIIEQGFGVSQKLDLSRTEFVGCGNILSPFINEILFYQGKIDK